MFQVVDLRLETRQTFCHGWEEGVPSGHQRGIGQPMLGIAAWPARGAEVLTVGAKRSQL